jgi:membrane protease YdiL (CAAX protease family)
MSRASADVSTDRTIEATPLRAGAASLADRPGRWAGGRIALAVSGFGLLAAAIGGIWFGLEAQLGVNPGGLAGIALVIAAVALLVIGLLLLVGGLAWYVLAPGFMGGRMPWYGFGSHRLVFASTVLIVLLANAGPVAYTSVVGVRGLCSIPGFLTAALSVDLALLGITYFRFIRPGVVSAGDLGLTTRRLPHYVGLGLLVGVGVLVVSALIQAAMQALGVRQTQLADLSCVRDFPLIGFFAVVFAGGILAPIAEELYFRGFVFRSYLGSSGPFVAYGVTSLLFATLHLNLPALLPILVLSLIFCYAYQRTGSIIPSMVGHAVNNSAAFCILYFTSAPLGPG